MTVPSINLPGMSSDSGSKLVKQRVLAGLKVYPHGGDPVFGNRSIETIHFDWRPDTDASFRRLSWQKAMGVPAGQWKATVKEKRLGSLSIGAGDILPDDWVDIVILRNGVEIPVCRGIIDTVTDTTVGMGSTVRTWELTGRDHGALWEFPIAYQNIYVRTLNELVAGLFTKRFKGKVGGNPSDLFNILINGAFTKGNTSSTWILPDRFARARGIGIPALNVGNATFKAPMTGSNGAILDILDIDNKSKTRGAYYNEVQFWTKPGEGLGQTISNWCNPLLNEFIYDLAIDKNYPNSGKSNARVSALIRERPFPAHDNARKQSSLDPVFSNKKSTISSFNVTAVMDLDSSPWGKLTTWDLPNWLIQKASLTRSNAERYNLFELLADVGLGGSEGEQCAQAPPSIYRDSMEKHGLRPMLESSRFVSDGNKGMADWVQDRKHWQKMLVDWHCLNPWFFSGTIEYPIALPEIRIGQRLRSISSKAENAWAYYVESINLNWSAGQGARRPPTAQTAFSVTRGWRGTDVSLLNAVLKVGDMYKTIF